MYNFIKVGAAIPKLKVADCIYNTIEILNLIKEAKKNNIKILNFPELCITSYSCGDLFMQSSLIESAQNSLKEILFETKDIDMFITLGIPIRTNNQCFNCSVAIYKGKILGVIPKTFIPNYSEFYEERWFASSSDIIDKNITLCGQICPIGTDILFKAENIPNLIIGIEICEDLWATIPPSSYHSLAGATVILNLSASNDIATKSEYRHSLVAGQSARCICAYVYTSCGIYESTQDVVFSGDSMIYENGKMLEKSIRFSKENQIIMSDIDIELLSNDRIKTTSYMSGSNNINYRIITFDMSEDKTCDLKRIVNPKPFIPANNKHLNERCQDIFNIQVTGLARRIMHTSTKKIILGISGGLDSTLALLVAVKTCDFLNIERNNVLGVTMPGFGTTDRTYNNAINLMKSLNIETKEISIKEAALQHFKDIEHNPEIHDIVYENTQARERTQILMDYANKENGLVVGTGDLSELALGWATYNGDHMSMYGVNAGIPKTLVRVLVKWVAEFGNLDKNSNNILFDILETPVSPELLPPDKDGKISQKTEDLVGPYELHDFFLYYVVRFGFSPDKIYFLAQKAFNGIYEKDIILKWLKNFYRRFFSQQFKRSCLPDGPKVGAICLSPRGDWRMSSDASNNIWLSKIDEI